MGSAGALVTGATGFVGSSVVRHLCEDGWGVTALVRRTSPADRVDKLRTYGAVVAEADGSLPSLRAALIRQRTDVVFHLATLFRGEHHPSDVQPLVEANVLFGTQLLEAMRLEGVSRIVAAGTAWEHYDNREYSPASLYAATKAAFVSILRYYTEVEHVQGVVLDLSDTYGVGDTRPKLLRRLLAAAATGEPLEMNSGDPWIDLLHSSDAAAAFRIAAERLLASGVQAFERWAVRPGEPCTLRALVHRIESVLGKPVPVRWGARPYRPRESFVPWTSGALLPGWAPRVPFDVGLRDLARQTAGPA